MFNKEIKVSEFKSDMKYNSDKSDENLKGLKWDATFTKLVVWSNCSLYIVSHETSDVIANQPRINKTLGTNDIRLCKFVRGTIVGLIGNNMFF